MKQIPKLTSVNRILKSLTGSRLSDLNSAASDEEIEAVEGLDTATLEIQINNQWNLNKYHRLTVVADANDEIVLDNNILYMKPVYWSNGSLGDLSVKDGKIYDFKNQTTAVGGEVTLSGTRYFTYDELPAAFQLYAQRYATADLVSDSRFFSAARAQIADVKKLNAFQAVQKFDATLGHNTLDNNPSIRMRLRDNGGNDSRWGI